MENCTQLFTDWWLNLLRNFVCCKKLHIVFCIQLIWNLKSTLNHTLTWSSQPTITPWYPSDLCKNTCPTRNSTLFGLFVRGDGLLPKCPATLLYFIISTAMHSPRSSVILSQYFFSSVHQFIGLNHFLQKFWNPVTTLQNIS